MSANSYNIKIENFKASEEALKEAYRLTDLEFREKRIYIKSYISYPFIGRMISWIRSLLYKGPEYKDALKKYIKDQDSALQVDGSALIAAKNSEELKLLIKGIDALEKVIDAAKDRFLCREHVVWNGNPLKLKIARSLAKRQNPKTQPSLHNKNICPLPKKDPMIHQLKEQINLKKDVIFSLSPPPSKKEIHLASVSIISLFPEELHLAILNQATLRQQQLMKQLCSFWNIRALDPQLKNHQAVRSFLPFIKSLVELQGMNQFPAVIKKLKEEARLLLDTPLANVVIQPFLLASKQRLMEILSAIPSARWNLIHFNEELLQLYPKAFGELRLFYRGVKAFSMLKELAQLKPAQYFALAWDLGSIDYIKANQIIETLPEGPNKILFSQIVQALSYYHLTSQDNFQEMWKKIPENPDQKPHRFAIESMGRKMAELDFAAALEFCKSIKNNVAKDLFLGGMIRTVSLQSLDVALNLMDQVEDHDIMHEIYEGVFKRAFFAKSKATVLAAIKEIPSIPHQNHAYSYFIADKATKPLDFGSITKISQDAKDKDFISHQIQILCVSLLASYLTIQDPQMKAALLANAKALAAIIPHPVIKALTMAQLQG